MTTTLRTTCAAALRTLAADIVDGAPDRRSEQRAAQRHVESCPRCSGLLDDDGSAERALQRIAHRRGERLPRFRRVLFLLGSCQLALALPWLVGWNPIGPLAGHVSASHLTRDGALGVIVAVAGLLTAMRPRHAVAMMFTAVAAIVMQGFGFAVDESSNRVSAVYEALHLLIPLITACIGYLALRRDAPVEQPARPPRLRAVR